MNGPGGFSKIVFCVRRFMVFLAVTGLAASADGAVLPYLEEFTGLTSPPAGYAFTLPAPVHYSGNDPAGDPSFGPGLGANDGAISVEGNQTLDPLSTVSFTFAGTMVPGEQYTFATGLFQSSTSYPTYRIDLLSGSDSVAFVTGSGAGGAGGNNGVVRTINYTAVAGDAGKSLSFVAAANRPAGVFSAKLGIDWVQLSVVPVPEPSALAISAMALACGLRARMGRRLI